MGGRLEGCARGCCERGRQGRGVCERMMKYLEDVLKDV